MVDKLTSRPGRRRFAKGLMSRGALLLTAVVIVVAGPQVLDSGAKLLAQALPGAPRNLRLQVGSGGSLGGWPTAGANVQRTSHSLADVSTVRSVAWYRPIEAYIHQGTQLITADGRVYVATARGLVVLDAENGALVCRFDTELPVSTPTVDNGVVYLPGYDRTLYALNGSNCGIVWTFTGASGGFSANPLVTSGRVFIGNRDGRFYAINASNGSQVWAFDAGGPIMESAAYDNGVLYFAAMDFYGYALDATTGALVWRTPQKLPGERYTAWWPVVYGQYVVWSASPAYKPGTSPGMLDAGPKGVSYDAFFDTSTQVTAGTVVTSSDGSHGWPAGSRVMDTATGPAPSTLQAWVDGDPARRIYAVVDRSTGVEPFILPLLYVSIKNGGQMHPPVYDGTSALVFSVPFMGANTNIPRARPMAWKPETSWLKMVGNITFAADEPLYLSMTSGRLFGNLCCDREARELDPGSVMFWHYSNMLDTVLPSQGEPNSYDPMWAFYDGPGPLQRLGGYYKGNTTSRNGVYHVHGLQNPLVPLAYINGSSVRVERMFTHRSNAIIAVGPTATQTYVPLLTINQNPANLGRTLTTGELRLRLEREVQRMVDLFVAHGESGFLRPAYVADGGRISNTMAMPETDVYFRFPADTIYSLSVAYHHLSSGLQSQLRSYLAAYWQRYFVANRVRSLGWSFGSPRESMTYPPVVAARMAQLGDAVGGSMPQRLFYAAWRYAQVEPSQAANIYNAVRPSLIYPPESIWLDIVRGPGIYNDYIAGYQGFLNLYDMLGTNPEPSLRANVASELSSLLNTRLTNFATEHPWQGDVDNPTGIGINHYVRRFNCTRNFLYMTPALGQAMRLSAQAPVILDALNQYQYMCSHWFIARDANSFQEAAAHHIFDSHALFLAKAYVAAQSQAELSKWLDVPWVRGDLYHIQNLAAALEAGGGVSLTSP